MLTLKSNKKLANNLKHSLLAGAFLLLLILGAKVDIDLGGLVSFTLQTLFLGLAYYYLPIPFRLVVILSYLVLGIVGVPVFNGGVGWNYFISWPFGFFVGFVLAAFIPKPVHRTFISGFRYFIHIHVVIVVLGLIGIFHQGGSHMSPWEHTLDLLPGLVIKSVAGAGIIWYVAKLWPTTQFK
jgi:biotin transport system substrate-specific component